MEKTWVFFEGIVVLRGIMERRNVAGGHDAESQRRDVQEQDIADFALEDAALDRCTNGYDFIGVDPLVRLFAAEILRDVDHLGHAGHAADQNELIDLGRREIGVLQAVLVGLNAALEEGVADLLHLGAAQLDVQVLRPRGVRGDKGEIDVDRLESADSAILAFSASSFRRWRAIRVLAQVDPVVLLEAVDQERDDGLVPVVAAQVGVAVGGLHLENAVADFQDGDIEGAAAQVEDRDLFILLLVEAVGERGGRRLVDDSHDVEAGDLAGILRRLALRVIEIRRDGDDRLGDLFAEVGFRVGFHLWREDEGGDLLGRKLLGLVADLRLNVGVPRSYPRSP